MKLIQYNSIIPTGNRTQYLRYDKSIILMFYFQIEFSYFFKNVRENVFCVDIIMSFLRLMFSIRTDLQTKMYAN